MKFNLHFQNPDLFQRAFFRNRFQKTSLKLKIREDFFQFFYSKNEKSFLLISDKIYYNIDYRMIQARNGFCLFFQLLILHHQNYLLKYMNYILSPISALLILNHSGIHHTLSSKFSFRLNYLPCLTNFSIKVKISIQMLPRHYFNYMILNKKYHTQNNLNCDTSWHDRLFCHFHAQRDRRQFQNPF